MSRRRGCVDGCGFDAPHAGSHGAPARPTSASCAPARCYCGGCPSWTPRVPPPPPRLPAERVAQHAAAARDALRDLDDLDDARRRGRDDRRRAERRRAGLTVAGARRLVAA